MQSKAQSVRGGIVEFYWVKGDDQPSLRFIESLCGLLYSSCESIRFSNTEDDLDDVLSATRILRAIRSLQCAEILFFGGVCGAGWVLERKGTEVIRLSIAGTGETNEASTGWLQAEPLFAVPLPILALPAGCDGPCPRFLHALVALAMKCGEFERAEWAPEESSDTRAEWSYLLGGGIPLRTINGETLWFLCPSSGSVGAEHDKSLLFSSTPEISRFAVDVPLPEDLRSMLIKTPVPWDAISNRCNQCLGGQVHVEVAPLNLDNSGEFRQPLQTDSVLAIRPQDDRVIIQVDTNQPDDLSACAIAHAVGHVLLGHVQPGDSLGHWDTRQTLSNGHRRWDREVRETFPGWFEVKSRIRELSNCTPRDKALLGLWRMIHESLGESSKLHPRAEHYQRAAYQRQAAERLIAQLEQFGGAMLCDGVGLGKTYIATTVMVHYANRWQDALADGVNKNVAPDYYRITVLAPNSVVSTWLREAIPPLYSFGILPNSIRVFSHTKLSRITSSSDVLTSFARQGLSDLEHLILSDLVIVDEAHNFRTSDARRSLVLRDLLRLQPRKELGRKVLLLTATPVNNSLDDLRQQAALLFSRPIPLSDAATDDGYRRQAIEEIRKRAKRARSKSADKGNVAALVAHGDGKASFSKRLEFRDDLDFGPRVQRIGDYLNEQDQKLKAHQEEIRNRALNGTEPEQAGPRSAVRVADELLDRIVVQRSRHLCKEIERQAGSTTEILFRRDAGPSEKLHYSDEYDGIHDVLAGFLPLFERLPGPTVLPVANPSGIRPLSLRIYMWFDVREGFKQPDEFSPVVGLQRALVLKRLESSPVSLLISLLRLTVFHAYRLQQLLGLCRDLGDRDKLMRLQHDVAAILDAHPAADLDKIRSLATGDTADDPVTGFLDRLARSHQTLRPVADSDDAPVRQLALDLYGDEETDEETQLQREQVERLWGLKEALLEDFDTLLQVSPGLADIIFGKFDRSEWPRKFIAGGLDVDWPTSAAWGQRIVSDAKIRRLVSRLLEARRRGQKTIVFSQFTDTLAYIQSVLRACRQFARKDWAIVVAGLGIDRLHAEEMEALLGVTDIVTGDTEDRDSVVNAFAPYYRIGPFPPAVEGVSNAEAELVVEEWAGAWREAINRPIDVLLATDVLAEGVNLQDAALLINFDIHWNPVRMIQRSGRIDRRLNPRIEHLAEAPELAAIAAELGKEPPAYYWHGRTDEAPLTVNMILPDELERELLLRERIAIKTLAIDFTLGLDQGTGAEADWMASYKFQGISSLNAFQKDRAIEQIAGYHEKLTHDFARRGIDREWSRTLNVWVRQAGRDAGVPLIARAAIGQKGGGIDPRLFSRYLDPAMLDGVPCWLWSEEKPRDSLLNQWLVLDSKSLPPRIEKKIPWHESASYPVTAHHLLVAVRDTFDERVELDELPLREIGKPLQQGITAVSAGFFGDDDSRRNVKIEHFFLLQLGSFEDNTLSA